jgi:metal-responsive CopG/Arc/MetJ family transcriptional regulator
MINKKNQSEKVLISMPIGFKSKIDDAANKDFCSRSEFLRRAAIEKMKQMGVM